MFLSELILEEDPAPEIWIVDAPLIWQDAEFGTITVPLGFRTDLASTPLHIASNGRSRRAAAVHDFLYASNRKHGIYDKHYADDFLCTAMQADGCPRWMAEGFYLAVHWFGGPAWRSDARFTSPDGQYIVNGDFDTSAHYDAWLLSERQKAIINNANR